MSGLSGFWAAGDRPPAVERAQVLAPNAGGACRVQALELE